MTKQLNLPLGLALKDEGIKKVAQNNEAWLESMRKFARLHSRAVGYITTDDLRDYCDRLTAAGHAGFIPTHRNAWGAVFQGSNWQVVGRTKSKIPSNHGREIRVWKWVGG